MPRARVPGALIDNSYENFPKGFYDGDITGAEVRDPNGDGSWLTLKLSVDNITPKEGTADPGRTRFQGDITLRTDGVDLSEVEDFGNGDIPYGVRKAGGLIAGIAEGLNVATRGDDGVLDVDLAAMVDALTSGDFEGERVGFEVSHYSPKTSDKTYDQFNQFGPAS